MPYMDQSEQGEVLHSFSSGIIIIKGFRNNQLELWAKERVSDVDCFNRLTKYFMG